MTRGYWGFHLTVDAADCDRAAITNPEVLREFTDELVREIDMVKYGDAQIVHFGHGQEHLSGWTVIQLIETSNIICHFCDHTGEGYIDIFSCKEYDVDVALRVIDKYFKPVSKKTNYLIRQA